MMIWIYRSLWYLGLPIVLLHRLWRDRQVSGQLVRLKERLGFSGCQAAPSLWLHAVSLGESRAAIPLIEALLQQYPQLRMLVTTTTTTGSEQITRHFGARVMHCYLPWDLPGAVQRFLDRAQPQLALIMETELWPTLLTACQRRQIPLMLLNARISERSVRGYRRLARLFQPLLQTLDIAVQSEQDLLRFHSLGAHHAWLAGNLKYDQTLPAGLEAQAQQWRAAFGTGPIWLAASTHAGEEELIVRVWQRLQRQYPALQLLLAPRHPERVAEISQSLAGQGLEVSKRSDHFPLTTQSAKTGKTVFMVDSIGELLQFYVLAQFVTVGGSFVPVGGHNVLEPALLAKPICFGPHMFHFEAICAELLQDHAAEQVLDEEELTAVLLQWLASPQWAKALGVCAQQTTQRHKGALQRILRHIDQTLIINS